MRKTGKFQRRVPVVGQVGNAGSGLAQRIDQHGNGPLLHARGAGEAAAPVRDGQVGREETHHGAGVLGAQFGGAGCSSQQMHHQLRVVGIGQVAEGAPTGQGLQDEGAVGFAFGSRKLGGAAQRAAGPGEVHKACSAGFGLRRAMKALVPQAPLKNYFRAGRRPKPALQGYACNRW